MTAHTSDKRQQVLDAERAVNERYRKALETRVKKTPNLARSVAARSNARWTGTGPRTVLSRSAVSPVVGRVALEEPYDEVGRSFYVGGNTGEELGVDGASVFVVSWAAPLGHLFYDPENCSVETPPVLGRRTFHLRDDDVTDFEDDFASPGFARDIVFPPPSKGSVAVPAAPGRVTRPTRRPRPDDSSGHARPVARPNEASADGGEGLHVLDAAPSGLSAQAARSELSEDRPVSVPSEATSGDRPSPTDSSVNSPSMNEGPQMRAERSVRAAIEAPRTGRLGSVLATLQPDQYRLVRAEADRSMVVQGGPGTGKTIVATHRAAYLVHEEREKGALPLVGLIGPSAGWVDHTRHSVQDLDGKNVDIHALPTLLRQYATLVDRNMEVGGEERFDSSRDLGQVLVTAVRALVGAYRTKQSLPQVVGRITSLDPVVRNAIGDHEAAVAWLRDAHSWGWMARHARYLPALALIGIELSGNAKRRWYHVIVDEAQDLRPMEWMVIERHARASASFTLVGDLNQRRCDWTHPAWTSLAGELDIVDSNAEIRIETMTRGYRSTRCILRFADQLLPAAERSTNALREGTDPVIHRVRSQLVPQAVLEAATKLVHHHGDGIVAVISVDRRPLFDRFRSAGWRSGRSPHAVMRDDQQVFLLEPDDARGLEFDGVVVVEPGAFPQNLGRDGVLYTSLTRGTKSLTIVHSAPFPKSLRPPRGSQSR